MAQKVTPTKAFQKNRASCPSACKLDVFGLRNLQTWTGGNMFIGHFGVAMAAKRAAPNASLGLLFLAAQWVDLLWPLFLLLGLEHVRLEPGNTLVTPLDFHDYPLTHSLIGFVFWSLMLAGVTFWFTKQMRMAVVGALLVMSHWLLDFVTHRPDLPLAPGLDIKIGLGLWNSMWGTMLVEGLIFGMGVFMYAGATRPVRKTGSLSYWLLMLFLVAVWLANLFGPPPPDERTIAIAGNATWLIVLWGFWADRNRVVRSEA